MRVELLLKTVMPISPAKAWAEPIKKAFAQAELNTPQRQAAFLAQIAVESGQLTRVTENLNYGASALLRTFPKRFDADTVYDYARFPERIANRAYANRYGNGPESSGDGWRFRGRGPIQITFKDNYRACAEATGIPCLSHPEFLERPEEGAIAAAWYWTSRRINEAADAGDIVEVTRRVNSGLFHLSHRKAYYEKALSVLTAPAESTYS